MHRNGWIVLILALVALAITVRFVYVTITAPMALPADKEDPINLRQDPIQATADSVTLPTLVFGNKQFVLIPQAQYSIDGYLVSRKHYLRGLMKQLSPWDYALVWNDIPQHLKYLKFDQMVRFCLYHVKNGAPITPIEMERSFSNNHLIPATKNIRKALALAKKGDLIRLKGYLVNVTASQDGRILSHWNSSTNRTDRGNGACEIIYVNSLRINDLEYE